MKLFLRKRFLWLVLLVIENIVSHNKEVRYLESSLTEIVDIKSINYQIFLQQRWTCLGSAENCNVGPVNGSGHVQVPRGEGRRPLLRRRWEVVRAMETKRQELFAGRVLTGSKRSLSSCWAAVVRSEPSPFWTTGVFCLLIFCKIKGAYQ